MRIKAIRKSVKWRLHRRLRELFATDEERILTLHVQMFVPAAAGRPSSGTLIDVPTNSFQLTWIERYINFVQKVK